LEAETNFNIRGKADVIFFISSVISKLMIKIRFLGTLKINLKYQKLQTWFLKFQANKSQADGYYSIIDTKIIPALEIYITFISDFGRTAHSILLASVTYSDWV
jgi:hypothetical protein